MKTLYAIDEEEVKFIKKVLRDISDRGPKSKYGTLGLLERISEEGYFQEAEHFFEKNKDLEKKNEYLKKSNIKAWEEVDRLKREEKKKAWKPVEEALRLAMNNVLFTIDANEKSQYGHDPLVFIRIRKTIESALNGKEGESEPPTGCQLCFKEKDCEYRQAVIDVLNESGIVHFKVFDRFHEFCVNFAIKEAYSQNEIVAEAMINKV